VRVPRLRTACGSGELLFGGPGASTLGDAEPCCVEYCTTSPLTNDFTRVLRAHLEKKGVSGCWCVAGCECIYSASHRPGLSYRPGQGLDATFGGCEVSHTRELLTPVQVSTSSL